MAYFQKEAKSFQRENPAEGKIKFYRKKWFRILTVLILIIAAVGGYFSWKTSSVLSKISKGGLLSSIVHNIPGVKDEAKGEKEGRINIAILGMRGEGVAGGGLLADTIMVISVKPAENKAAIISIPRDLYVTVPGTQDKQKINAVHAYGEEKGKGKGLEAMKTILSEVTGLPIHYAASINFQGFIDLVEAVGGVTVHLDQPFQEGVQFHEPHVCDPYIYTVPAKDPKTKVQMYENKYYTRQNGTKYLAKSYPLCYNKDEECGGVFGLPAGDVQLNGKNALCYARARYGSSDFERAKRQQQVLQIIKNKMTSMGTLSDFSKINGILDSLGNNVRTDMQLWEMQRLYDIYKQVPDPEIHQRVLEDSEEGLLYYPGESAAGYILLPRGDNYDKIHELAQNIFTLPSQNDIRPK
jgi:polyisoprenyl-teichoic acid--peptidoglycan teichoic acid transferase